MISTPRSSCSRLIGMPRCRRSSDLTEQLTASHARAQQLNKQVSGLAELPKNTEDLDDRCRRMVQLAQHQAAEITARAQAAASHTWASAEDSAAKLRGSYEKMLATWTSSARKCASQHAELVKQARISVADMTTAATKQRHEQDAQAEGRRVKIEQDFERGMTAQAAGAGQGDRAAARRAAGPRPSGASARRPKRPSAASARPPSGPSASCARPPTNATAGSAMPTARCRTCARCAAGSPSSYTPRTS